ncbi:response regulator transcription factor [Alteromonas oceanisediminis]|uniref:response regulator transcription factor n=1 Tax=Alteromonas oceanisediminis TaxID=2836180 RepID=UPI001BDA6589|nr:response regulator transcription factor [Alteromonas oceanisediminis]MBT0585997.1 response regulator transcription factor [Alteromonas oceanisediminis]
MTDSILVVEDDLDIADLIRVNLSELGIAIAHAACGKEGLSLAMQNHYDLMLLDVMLPEINGLDICRNVRAQKPEQSIIMLTAKNSETDRVLGLELGADDYMTKPFSVRELQARVRAQLRKVHMLRNARHTEDSSASLLQLGSLCIDVDKHLVTLNAQALELTATEFELLNYLARHPNQVFSRAQLLESVWGYHHSGYEHTVNSHINRLRAKIEEDATHPRVVQTVWGVGYKLNPAGVNAAC